MNTVFTLVYEFCFYLLFDLIFCGPTKVRQPEEVLTGLTKYHFPLVKSVALPILYPYLRTCRQDARAFILGLGSSD